MRVIVGGFAALVLGAASAFSQTPFGITAAQATRDGTQISVRFSDPLAGTGPHTNAANVTLENAAGVTVKGVQLSLLNPVITVALSAPLPPTPVRICFARVAYLRQAVAETTSNAVCATVVTDAATIDAAKAAALKVLTDTPIAAPDEKRLNTSGFVTTASDNTEGGADIALNPTFSDPNASAFFRLKKTTAEEGDPRHFEVGVAYRRGIPWKRGELAALGAATDTKVVTDLLAARQRQAIAGTVLSFAMKLEGDPTTFDAANGVGELDYSIVSMTKRLVGESGFWRGYASPGGVEIGRKLAAGADGAPTTDHDWIVRYKVGGGFKVFFKAPQQSLLPVSRFDFAADGTWRYLGVEEVNFNAATKALDRVTDGGHGYVEASLKAFFVEVDNRRFGVKASYNRGSLPPVFADVKSFQFGFLVESNDKD